MSRSFKIFLTVSALLLAAWFLYPSLSYYFMTPADIRAMVERGKITESEDGLESDDRILFEKASKHKKNALTLGLDIKGGMRVVIEADFKEMATNAGKELSEISERDKADAIERVIHKLQTRIDSFGVSEVSIRKSGEKRVVVQIPGEKNTQRLERIIVEVGKLEFKLVNEDIEVGKDLEFERNEDTGKITILNPEIVPEGSEINYLRVKNNAGLYEDVQPIVLYSKVEMSGERLEEAQPQVGDYGEYGVSFKLDLRGAKMFSEITANNVDKRLAILLDSKVMSAPKINERIPSGSGRITGNFNHEEARDLSLILRSGSLPVPISIISQEVIGPSMGREDLIRSAKALFAGLLIVIGFMLIWYRLAGLVASIALILNGVGILALLAPLHYTISLPGIAGLILTMGMAIDANVIIFERIREEILVEKRSITDAIPLGYNKAFWTIMDANLTTLIAAAILGYFGTGVIQGFAVVLFFGIVVSLFTSLGLTRLIFEILISKKVIKNYSKLIV
jgi:preprotein translocase subunit SecD